MFRTKNCSKRYKKSKKYYYIMETNNIKSIYIHKYIEKMSFS